MHHQSTTRTPLRITEEVFNSITHGVAAVAGMVGLIIGLFLITDNLTARVGFLIYGVSLILLMTVSSLYHALFFSRAKNVFQILDRSSIFVLIAGSYTPFLLILYDGWVQIFMLVLVWAIAVSGVVVNAVFPRKIQRIGLGLYIGFGWLALALIPKFGQLDGKVAFLLLFGGVLYTLGALLMIIKKPFIHVGWHIFVVGAAVAHYFAILFLLS